LSNNITDVDNTSNYNCSFYIK